MATTQGALLRASTAAATVVTPRARRKGGGGRGAFGGALVTRAQRTQGRARNARIEHFLDCVTGGQHPLGTVRLDTPGASAANVVLSSAELVLREEAGAGGSFADIRAGDSKVCVCLDDVLEIRIDSKGGTLCEFVGEGGRVLLEIRGGGEEGWSGLREMYGEVQVIDKL